MSDWAKRIFTVENETSIALLIKEQPTRLDDEFCALLPRRTARDAERIYCQRVAQAVGDRLPGVSLGFGIAQTDPNAFGTPEALVEAADQDMYRARRARKSAPAMRSIR